MENKESLVKTSQMLTKGYGLELVKRVSSLTVATAQKGEQLSKLKRENEDETIAMISTAINNLNDAVNIGNKMSADQIIETTVVILTEYWMMKIDEVLNCFKMVKSGRMGKIYGLDQPTVMGFLHKYDTEIKADYYEEIAPTHTSRARKESQGTKHIALSVDEIKKLQENEDKTPL